LWHVPAVAGRSGGEGLGGGGLGGGGLGGGGLGGGGLGGGGLGGGGEGNGGGGLGDGEGGLGDRTRPSNGDCGGDGMPTTAISTGSHCSGQALTKERDSGLLGGPTASE